MTQQPFFSIVIPTYNRPQQLALCLQSLARQDYPRFEVIVVDDGSEVLLSELVLSFRDQLDITLLTQDNAGPAAARNTGAAQAKGRFFAFTDDDCQPDANWLKNLAAAFKKNPNNAIGGKTINQLPKNIYSTASQLLIDYLYSYYNSERNQARFLTTNNLALPAKLFHAINGFDTHFPLAAAEDRDFCHRWLNNGYRMIYNFKIVVYHEHHLTLFSFWRQQFNYGKGAFLFHRAKRSDSTKEPKSFYWHLIRYPFSKANLFKASILVILMMVSQVAITAGYFWEAVNK
ncbi:MAG: glycosyl transferase [Candidatus Parabeggiatoa sp. nov. 3]|nr:MAG: glycosyl transferase [Gammaproteobacteria bacterium]RKZ64904.1 MAG: glycosyl transferase [Gammaproteobacteria bacterium]RKZ88681.1 MAG: glycosyl transferase [Gammaproteobacteria bacterium]